LPEILKAGFLIGANYGEGFLIRDGKVVAFFDLAGGNLGLQTGGHTYSQVTYILSEKLYQDLVRNNRINLNGAISVTVNGLIKSSMLTSDTLKGDLYTVHFNETGTVLGASIEDLYNSVSGLYSQS